MVNQSVLGKDVDLLRSLLLYADTGHLLQIILFLDTTVTVGEIFLKEIMKDIQATEIQIAHHEDVIEAPLGDTALPDTARGIGVFLAVQVVIAGNSRIAATARVQSVVRVPEINDL